VDGPTAQCGFLSDWCHVSIVERVVWPCKFSVFRPNISRSVMQLCVDFWCSVYHVVHRPLKSLRECNDRKGFYNQGVREQFSRLVRHIFRRGN